ncbi:MAG: hypothetical protein ACREKH_01465, partial [Candidatus Rokuibacteriota bacterium]
PCQLAGPRAVAACEPRVTEPDRVRDEALARLAASLDELERVLATVVRNELSGEGERGGAGISDAERRRLWTNLGELREEVSQLVAALAELQTPGDRSGGQGGGQGGPPNVSR